MRILLLTHRIPYPPDKGDKIRSFRLLECLASVHDVSLITHADDPRDSRHASELARRCRKASVHSRGLFARAFGMVAAMLGGRPLSFGWFHSARARREVRDVIARDAPDAIVVFSAQPAEYLPRDLEIPVIVDLVDVDSEKWRLLAGRARGVMRWIYAREARLVAAFERSLADRRFAVTTVTAGEAEAFAKVAPGASATVVSNGVRFAHGERTSARRGFAMIFVGALDYPPNVEAASIAAREVLPRVREKVADARLVIVGRNPVRAVRALGRHPGVELRGDVSDLTAVYQDAAVALIPLEVVRGVPNKLLEAFAHGLPVVTTPVVLAAVGARAGVEGLCGTSAEDLAARVLEVAGDPARGERIGAAGARFARERFDWARFDEAILSLVEETVIVGARA